MDNLKIYHPDKFYPSRTFVIYSTVSGLLVLSYILQELGYDHNTIVFDSTVFLAFTCLMIGIILRVFTMTKVKPLYGKLDGEITFFKEHITVHGERITIDRIKKIEFKGVDCVGLDENYISWSLENGLSNGTKNWLIIYLINSSLKKIRFQQYKACELLKFKEVLLDYYVSGKISYLQMVDCLCLKSPEEWNKLKSMKTVTNANNAQL